MASTVRGRDSCKREVVYRVRRNRHALAREWLLEAGAMPAGCPAGLEHRHGGRVGRTLAAFTLRAARSPAWRPCAGEKNGPHLAMRAGLLRPGTCRGDSSVVCRFRAARAGWAWASAGRRAGMDAIVGSRRACCSVCLLDKRCLI